MEDLQLSVAAVVLAEACNVGLTPVINDESAALTRARLSHIDQNYVRADTRRAHKRHLANRVIRRMWNDEQHRLSRQLQPAV